MTAKDIRKAHAKLQKTPQPQPSYFRDELGRLCVRIPPDCVREFFEPALKAAKGADDGE